MKGIWVKSIWKWKLKLSKDDWFNSILLWIWITDKQNLFRWKQIFHLSLSGWVYFTLLKSLRDFNQREFCKERRGKSFNVIAKSGYKRKTPSGSLNDDGGWQHRQASCVSIINSLINRSRIELLRKAKMVFMAHKRHVRKCSNFSQ